jgi:hypothetical protein
MMNWLNQTDKKDYAEQNIENRLYYEQQSARRLKWNMALFFVLALALFIFWTVAK